MSQVQPAITIDNNGNVYVIWTEYNVSTDSYIMWMGRSSNGGMSFDFVKRINEDANWSQIQPSIAVGSDGKVHVVWIDREVDPPGIYYANSTDGGISFNPSVRVMDTTAPFKGSVARHLIAIDGNNKIHVVWGDRRSGGNTSVYYANSTDGGISFNPNVRVSDSDATATEPSIAVDENDNIYVVWTDYRNVTTRGADIYFSKSGDGGISFSPNKRVNDDLGNTEQKDVSIAVNNGIIGIVWDDARNGGRDIYFANSTDGGENFDTNKKVNDDIPSGNWLPSIAINRTGYIGVVWEDGRNGDWDIYFASSTDGGATFSADQRVNDDVGTEYQYAPHIAMDDNGHFYVVWQDHRNGTIWDIYLSRSNIPPPMAMPISPLNDSTITDYAPTLEVTSVTDLDNDTVYYNFIISDQPDAESGTNHSSGWILSTSWKTPSLPNGKWYWHAYTSDMWNVTSPNWVWNFTIDAPLQSFGVPIRMGWNLISIPLMQTSTDILEVLNDSGGNTDWDRVEYYHIASPGYPWKTYVKSKPSQYNHLTNIDHTMGFWIHITDVGDGYLNVTGSIPTTTEVHLKKGWNLVGYPSLVVRNAGNDTGEAFDSISGYVDMVQYYNASDSSDPWEEWCPGLYSQNDLIMVGPGCGLWIHVKSDCIWSVDF